MDFLVNPGVTIHDLYPYPSQHILLVRGMGCDGYGSRVFIGTCRIKLTGQLLADDQFQPYIGNLFCSKVFSGMVK